MNKSLLRLFLFFVLATAMLLAFVFRDYFNINQLESWVEQSGSAAPLVFMLIYMIGTVLFLPGSVLTLLGGALFGPVLGTFYNLTAATLGAMLSFLAARYVASDWVEKKSAGRLLALKKGVEHEGWRFVAFVRLVPFFPFNLLNYALGLTRIKFSHYSLATYICMLPGAIAYTYIGYVGREALAGDQAIIQKVLVAIALVAAIGFVPRLVAMFRQYPMIDVQTLKHKMDHGDDLLLIDVRTADQYLGEMGHITGSLLLPLEELDERVDEVKEFKDRPVALICTTDRRSSRAADILQRHGYSDVHVVRQGMTDWNKAGYRVSRH